MLRKCLQGDPRQRFQSMAEVLEHPFLNEANWKKEIERLASFGTRGNSHKSARVQKDPDPTDDVLYADGSYAVIIAINDYESSGVDPEEGGMKNLACARQDGELMSETLKAKGFEVLAELYDQDAQEKSIRKVLSKVKKKLRGKPKARFVFFLACHGVLGEDEEEGWICCHGCDTEELEDTCISMKSIRDFSKRLNCSHQLYLFDCCHAGSFLEGTRSAPTKYELRMVSKPAIYGMTAVTRDQEAIETNGHGIFTKLVVDGLNGRVETGDRLYMTATELFSYVQRGVVEEAERRSRVQVPKFQPLWQMHQKQSCDGQVLFFKEEGSAAGSAAEAAKHLRESSNKK